MAIADEFADLKRGPDDRVYVFIHVATRPGEPIALGFADKIIDAEFDPPMVHLVVQVPASRWDEDHPQWEGPRHDGR